MSTKSPVQLKKVFLQYPSEGQPGPYGGGAVTADEADKWVDKDAASGGYPYPTQIDRAYDFRTVERANEYNKVSKGVFQVREVTVTYEF